MAGVDTRSEGRDSLFLVANVRVEQDSFVHRIRVRNLSNAGMMGQGDVNVQRGSRLTIELRNVGEVLASVAWVQDDRFGVAFDHEIVAQAVRRQDAGQPDRPVEGGIVREPVYNRLKRADPDTVRKV